MRPIRGGFIEIAEEFSVGSSPIGDLRFHEGNMRSLPQVSKLNPFPRFSQHSRFSGGPRAADLAEQGVPALVELRVCFRYGDPVET